MCVMQHVQSFLPIALGVCSMLWLSEYDFYAASCTPHNECSGKGLEESYIRSKGASFKRSKLQFSGCEVGIKGLTSASCVFANSEVDNCPCKGQSPDGLVILFLPLSAVCGLSGQ